jgi:hypothetical protein
LDVVNGSKLADSQVEKVEVAKNSQIETGVVVAGKLQHHVETASGSHLDNP